MSFRENKGDGDLIRHYPFVNMIKITAPLIAICLLTSGCQQIQTTEAKTFSDWSVKPGSVHDGDTFRAISNNREIKVRMACIDAPELKQPGGKEARDYLRKMLKDNQPINLAVSEKDRYGRIVAEVYVPTGKGDQEIAVNGEMVKNGWAHYYQRYNKACPDHAHLYEVLEKEAITKKAGVWKSGNAQKPWDWRKENRS